jgi:hypothetical protein
MTARPVVFEERPKATNFGYVTTFHDVIDLNYVWRQRAIRKHAQERLQIDIGQPTNTWPSADISQVLEFNSGGFPQSGPTNEEFLMDWGCAGLTDWTKDCITIFTADFVSRHHNGEFPALSGTITNESVSSAFRDYVMYLKRKACTETKDAKLAASKKVIADKRSRSLNRRHQVWLSRPIEPLRLNNR